MPALTSDSHLKRLDELAMWYRGKAATIGSLRVKARYRRIAADIEKAHKILRGGTSLNI
jgi:hypothetical protein